MEHRWGARSKLEVPVEIDCGNGTLAFGVIRDASVSGAFVCTAAQLPSMTIISVAPISPRCQSRARADAYVVRWTPEGCGLEWCDLAPDAIVELLYLSEAPSSMAAAESAGAREIVDPPDIRQVDVREDVAV